MKYLHKTTPKPKKYQEWLLENLDSHLDKQEEYEASLKNIFMMYIEEDEDNSPEDVEWHRRNHGAKALAEHLTDYGYEDEVKELILSKLKDVNGMSIEIGSKVKYIGSDADVSFGTELNISDISIDDLGMFNTHEFGNRLFHFSNVEKIDNNVKI